VVDTGPALDHGGYRVVLFPGMVANIPGIVGLGRSELEDYLMRPSSSLGRAPLSWSNWQSFKLKLAYDIYQAHVGADSCDVGCLFVQ
jgi:hypothetical protein